VPGEAAEVLGQPGAVARGTRGGGRLWGRPLRRALRSVAVLLGVGFALLVVAMALFAGVLAPAAPDEQNFDLIETPPSAKAWLGTDRFGRDVLSRVIYGSRISLYVALVSIGAAMLVGGALGLVAGYAGGGWDNLISRVMDVFFSIPGLLLAVGIAAMRGPGLNSAVIAIAIVYTPLFARVMPSSSNGRRDGRSVISIPSKWAEVTPPTTPAGLFTTIS